jgi:hypothetical protein
VFQTAKNIFGTTDRIEVTGYILPDGEQLRMSEEGIERDIDHRNIMRAFPQTELERLRHSLPSFLTPGSIAMHEFMRKGAIRVAMTNPGEIYLDVIRKPTSEQKSALRRILRDHEFALVEFTNPETANIEVWYEFGSPTGMRYHPTAVIQTMVDRGYAGIKKGFTSSRIQRSDRKGKKYKVRVCKKVRGEKVCKTIHFGATGYRIAPGTKKGDNYCARSSGIKGVDDPFSANYWARRIWGCKGKKSSKTRAAKLP